MHIIIRLFLVAVLFWTKYIGVLLFPWLSRVSAFFHNLTTYAAVQGLEFGACQVVMSSLFLCSHRLCETGAQHAHRYRKKEKERLECIILVTAWLLSTVNYHVERPTVTHIKFFNMPLPMFICMRTFWNIMWHSCHVLRQAWLNFKKSV